jgi:hypothetical protein
MFDLLLLLLLVVHCCLALPGALLLLPLLLLLLTLLLVHCCCLLLLQVLLKLILLPVGQQVIIFVCQDDASRRHVRPEAERARTSDAGVFDGLGAAGLAESKNPALKPSVSPLTALYASRTRRLASGCLKKFVLRFRNSSTVIKYFVVSPS